jgi:hypothetical protein
LIPDPSSLFLTLSTFFFPIFSISACCLFSSFSYS